MPNMKEDPDNASLTQDNTDSVLTDETALSLYAKVIKMFEAKPPKQIQSHVKKEKIRERPKPKSKEVLNKMTFQELNPYDMAEILGMTRRENNPEEKLPLSSVSPK